MKDLILIRVPSRVGILLGSFPRWHFHHVAVTRPNKGSRGSIVALTVTYTLAAAAAARAQHHSWGIVTSMPGKRLAVLTCLFFVLMISS